MLFGPINLINLILIIASLSFLPALKHSLSMHPNQGQGAVIFVSVVAQKFYPDISRPYLWVLNEKCLYFSGVSSLIRPNTLPLVYLDGVLITNTKTESSDHAREEFVVCKDNSIDPYIFLRGVNIHRLVICLTEHTESSIIINLFSEEHSESM
jgi:hypothetical protein